MLFENKQFKIEYICENKEKIHDFIVDIKDFDIDILFYQQPWGLDISQTIENVQ